jgi:hypothetical protein
MTFTLFDAINRMGLSHLATEESIVGRSQPVTDELAGIYFLIRSKQIVYVGQAVAPAGRIVTHVKEGLKNFDSFSIHHCREIDLNTLETLFIVHYSPFYNSQPANPIDESHPYQLVNASRVRKVLHANGFSPNMLKQWNKYGVLNPAGRFGNTDFYWNIEFHALLQELIGERGEVEHNRLMEEKAIHAERVRLERQRESDLHWEEMERLRDQFGAY